MKILRSQLPVVFAQKVPAKDKEGNLLLNEDKSQKFYTNFYVLLPSGKYVRIRPAYIGSKDKPDNRDLNRLLDNVPVITSVTDIE